MIIKQLKIENFRGVSEAKNIHFAMLNSIVGQNDSGKSTILKALDAFINDKTPEVADYNHTPTSDEIVIELCIDCKNKELYLGEEILTTLEKEELTNEDNLLVIKKAWKVSDSKVSKPKSYIYRKIYDSDNDYIFKTESQLMSLCKSLNIDTNKGNGEEYNNVEKREKLREFNSSNSIDYSYGYDELPATGKGKAKIIGDAIKKELPLFQYFKADTSLSDSDSAIQKYFKDLAFNLIKEEVDTDELEETITTQLGTVLKKVTDKINDVVKTNEKVEAQIDFDWSKLISTKFISEATENSLPLSSRGDGFRRITMMSYFEYLAETNRDNESQQIIFGFEEPETFLHPSAQSNLYEKLESMVENNYQVVISTHSPTIVGFTKKENIIHISKEGTNYNVTQNDIDYKTDCFRPRYKTR
jgi:putative ATP-dependent endonuclease of OLD family